MAKILVIDDDVGVRTTIEAILLGAGYVVLTAENGVRGMALIRSEQPDLVITDIVMPEQEGIQTITEIRSERPDLKIIAISGGGRIGSIDYLKFAQALGAMDTIPKPFEADELLTIVKNCLAGRARDPGRPGAMAENENAHAVARAVVVSFGANAPRVMERYADAHRRANEEEGADFWQRVADAARILLAGRSGAGAAAAALGRTGSVRRYCFIFATSTGHEVRSLNRAFDDDQQAEIFARGALNSTDPSIASVEAWERSRLVFRLQRDRLGE